MTLTMWSKGTIPMVMRYYDSGPPSTMGDGLNTAVGSARARSYTLKSSGLVAYSNFRYFFRSQSGSGPGQRLSSLEGLR